MTTSLVHIEAGKLRPIAIGGAERTPKLPNVPTVVEAGFPKLQSPFWLGVVAPMGTPKAIIDKLNAAFRESLKPAETKALLAKLGADIKIGSPADFEKMLDHELKLWTGVVKDAKIEVK
jgi:tripartite-type tricarboxylate transporter receptor subunit TctC